MIKGQQGKVFQIEPANLFGIVARAWLDRLGFLGAQEGQKDDADGPAARVASRVAKGAHLLHVLRPQSGLFFQFTPGGFFQRLERLDKAPREGPRPLKGWVLPPDQQHTGTAFAAGDDDGIDGD